MDQDIFPNDWQGAWRVLALAAGTVSVLLSPDKWFWPATGVVAGAFLTYEVVRRVNRSNDPRHAKRPPDGP